MKKSIYNYIKRLNSERTLIFNTKNHALVELNQDTYDKYDREDFEDAVAGSMYELGFLIDDDIDEIQELEKNRENACYYHDELTITVMVTEKCNFRCPYCYQDHMPVSLSAEKTQQLLLYLKNVNKTGKKKINISWFGGEPLLNMDPVFTIERYLKQEKIEGYSKITTNGYLINEELLDRLKRETRINSFQITLDGTQQQHNETRVHIDGTPTYKIICENISMTIKKGFFVVIRLNLTKKNCDMRQFFIELENLSLDKSMYAVHVTNANKFEASEDKDNFYFESAEEYAQAYGKVQDIFIESNYHFPRNYTKKFGCEFECNNVFLISPKLELFFCSSCELDCFFKQGYIDAQGQLILNENYKKRENLSAFYDEECKRCIVLPMCMGGCTYARIKNKKFCIPERYILDTYVLRLYNESKK